MQGGLNASARKIADENVGVWYKNLHGMEGPGVLHHHVPIVNGQCQWHIWANIVHSNLCHINT